SCAGRPRGRRRQAPRPPGTSTTCCACSTRRASWRDDAPVLQLTNTLTRAREPVRPHTPGRVLMYSCGPTVYRWAHIGNLRSFLLADLVRRTLEARGLEVRHVQNITDVGHMTDEQFDRGEDKMLVAAGLEHKSPEAIAEHYTQ